MLILSRGFADVESAIFFLRAGVWDYPLDDELLAHVLVLSHLVIDGMKLCFSNRREPLQSCYSYILETGDL